jgi:hypothetical protein
VMGACGRGWAARPARRPLASRRLALELVEKVLTGGAKLSCRLGRWSFDGGGDAGAPDALSVVVPAEIHVQERASVPAGEVRVGSRSRESRAHQSPTTSDKTVILSPTAKEECGS